MANIPIHNKDTREPLTIINLDDEDTVETAMNDNNDSFDFSTDNYLMNIKVKWNSKLDRIELRRVSIISIVFGCFFFLNST